MFWLGMVAHRLRRDCVMPNNEKRGPLDGSGSGTIGGGGRENGGPTERPEAPEMPAVKPENAASGRLAPDPLAATADPDELAPGPSDVQSH